MTTDVGVRIACLDLVSGCHGEPLEVVDVDLARFQGRWYELARLPRANQTAEVPRKSSRELRATGHTLTAASRSAGPSHGSQRVISGAAMVSSAKAPAKFSVDAGDFYADGWIIELDQDYRYAVIGHPTRKYLWIVSRAPSIDRLTFASILDRISAKGFDLSRLEFDAQRSAA